jgi:hypothetical protein
MIPLRRLLTTVLLVGSLAAAVLGQAPRRPLLDVRMGLWEITSTVNVDGRMPGVDTSRMTPQQRAEMAAAMRGTETPQTTSVTSCITREDFDRKNFVITEDRNCRQTITKNTKTRLDETIRCSGDRAANGTLHIEAQTPTAYTGTVKTTAIEQGRKTTTTVTMAGRWLAASCGDVK